MDSNYVEHLANDFLFLYDLCPNQSFPENSSEQILLLKWLDFLSNYEAEDLNDRRIQNTYMSNLTAAVFNGKLYGPFLKEPVEGKLRKVDFSAEAEKANACLAQQSATDLVAANYFPGELESQPFRNSYNSSGFESQGHISVATTNDVCTSGPVSSTCQCPPKYCQCTINAQTCTCERAQAGYALSEFKDEQDSVCNLPMRRDINPDLLFEFDATLDSLMDLMKVFSTHNQVPGQSSTRSHFSLNSPRYDYLTDSPVIQEINIITEHSVNESSPAATYEEVTQNINELLQAITAELKGEVEPGSNEYLDHELARYKKFLMENPHFSVYLSSLSSSMKLRHSLLLHMQHDLVNLLNDENSY